VPNCRFWWRLFYYSRVGLARSNDNLAETKRVCWAVIQSSNVVFRKIDMIAKAPRS
jgi:hypothetical protein